MEWYIYALLFVIAMVTVHLVSWVGNVLHSVPNGGTSGYAVFTFRGDQDRSMSTNILMNILFPNIVLIFMYMFLIRHAPFFAAYFGEIFRLIYPFLPLY